MKPCFGYIRVSTLKQGEGVSLEAQKEAILAFASRNDLIITRWFEEKQTAAKSGRPLFNTMLRLLYRRAASGVVMHKIDRSARNLRDWAAISELSDAGIDIHFATETLDFRSRGGRLTADIQAVIAADYIRNLREETRKGLDGRLKQGLFPFRAPIGYLDNGKGKPKTVDPRTAPLIREMFERYAAREASLRSLQREMVDRGLRNVNGGRVSLCGIETIINNPFYTGLIVIKRTGKSYSGIHEAIITPRLFEKVQDVKSGKCSPKVTRHNHLFRGLFRCGLCGGPMTPELQKGHVYYRCQLPGCETKTVREEKLGEAIKQALENLSIRPELAQRLEEKWLGQKMDDEHREATRALDLQIADEQARLERLTNLLIDGAIDRQLFAKKEQDLKLRLADLLDQRARVPDPAKLLEQRRDFLELMKNLAGLHEIAEPALKRRIVENCFSNRTVTGRELCLKPCNWLLLDEDTPPVLSGAPDRDKDRTNPVPAQLHKLLRIVAGRLCCTNRLRGFIS